MKVVCEGCQAKYRLPDDRVSGRKLKIRCRRCGGVMVIEGEHGHVSASGAQLDPSTPPGGVTMPPPVEAMQRPSQPANPTPQWHVSVDGAESGPYALAQLVQRLQSGAVPWDAYLWRDGFAAWVGVLQCPEVIARVSPPAVAPAPPSVAQEDAKTRIHQSGAYPPVSFQGSMGPITPSRGSVPARRSTPVPVPVPSRPVSVAPAVGMHAVSQGGAARNLSQAPLMLDEPEAQANPVRPSSKPTFRPSASVAPQYAPQTASLGSQPPFAGAQRDDAVLFSASQLGHVARPGGQSQSPQSRPGFAGGDSSGLVDIAALASLARQTSAPPVSRPALRPASMPNTPSVQLQPLPAVLDSLAPMSRRSGGSNKTVPLAILASSAMIASASFAAILLTRPTPPPAAAPAPVVAAAQPVAPAPVQVAAQLPVPEAAPAATAAVVAGEDDDDGVPAAAEPGVADPSAAEAAAPIEAAAAEPEAPPVARARTNKRATKATRAKQSSAKAAPEEEPLLAEKAAPQKKGAPAATDSSDVDDLLLADAPAKPAAAAKPTPAATDSSDVDELLAAPVAAKAAPAGKRSIDDLLDGAVSESAQKKKPAAAVAAPVAAPAAASAGLEAPGREDVLKAIKGVTPAVRACAAGQSGVAKVAITVSGGSGQVTSAQASGVDEPIKGCIEAAVRKAEFPSFSKPTFRVDYPFKF